MAFEQCREARQGFFELIPRVMPSVLLSAARDLMKFPRSQVDAVFGTEWHESRWGWPDANLAGGASIRSRTRIRIEPETSTVVKVADEVLAASAEFSIERTGWIEPGAREVLAPTADALVRLHGSRCGWQGGEGV